MPLANDQPSKPPVYGPVAPPKPPVYGPVAPQPTKPAPSTSSNNTDDFVRGGSSVVNGATPAPTPPKVRYPVVNPGQRNSSDLGGTKAGALPVQPTGPPKSSNNTDDFVRGGSSVVNGATPAPTPPKVRHPVVSSGQRNSSDLGGTKAGALPVQPTGPPKSSGVNNDFVRGGSQGSSIGNVGAVKPPKLADPKDPGPKKPGPGGEGTGTDTSATPGMLSINHDGQKGTKAGDKSDSVGTNIAPVGSGAGLSDLEKVRKFTYQIEKTEGKLKNLADQETELRQKMAVSNDGGEKAQLAAKLVSINKEQKVAGDRLDRKENRLNNVQNRMASAGTSDQLDQGVKAVAIDGGGNGSRNGGNNGNRNGGNGGGKSFENMGGGNALAGIGGPDAGRPQIAAPDPSNGNRNGGNGGGGGNGNGNGNGNNALPGGGNGGNGGGNGNGNGGGKKDNDPPKVMGGQAGGGGGNDSLPNNPPKLVSLGGGGGKPGKNR